jgi:predicted nucleic acid-binding protein
MASNANQVLIDSNIWIAQFSPQDSLHGQVRHLLSSISDQALFFTTNLILYECLTVLSMRVSRLRAVEFGEWFFDQATIRTVSSYIFYKREDHSWSIVSSSSTPTLSRTTKRPLAVSAF